MFICISVVMFLVCLGLKEMVHFWLLWGAVGILPMQSTLIGLGTLRKDLEKLRPLSVTELLLSNDGDQILEGCLTNFFIVCRKDENEVTYKQKDADIKRSVEVQTAPSGDGVLPGVVRQVIIELLNSTPVSYSEVHLTKKDNTLEGEDNLLREEGSKPECYTEEQEKLLGSTEMSWTLFVDRYGKDGKRIYDPVNGKTCHHCRQKTLGHRTHCSKCNMVQGQFCGDCLYMSLADMGNMCLKQTRTQIGFALFVVSVYEAKENKDDQADETLHRMFTAIRVFCFGRYTWKSIKAFLLIAKNGY